MNPRGWVTLVLGVSLLIFSAGVIMLGVNGILANPSAMQPGVFVAVIGLAILSLAAVLIHLGTPSETAGTAPPLAASTVSPSIPPSALIAPDGDESIRGGRAGSKTKC